MVYDIAETWFWFTLHFSLRAGDIMFVNLLGNPEIFLDDWKMDFYVICNYLKWWGVVVQEKVTLKGAAKKDGMFVQPFSCDSIDFTHTLCCLIATSAVWSFIRTKFLKPAQDLGCSNPAFVHPDSSCRNGKLIISWNGSLTKLQWYVHPPPIISGATCQPMTNGWLLL